MNENLTCIAVVLDESGSMSSVFDDTVGGLNHFIDEQKKQPGEATLTINKFSYGVTPLVTDVPLNVAPKIDGSNYCPSGSTALYDCIGYTIDSLGKRLAAMDESQRPARVIVVIQTDGYENASREYSAFKIREMIEHQKATYSWQFVFLGADQDAFAASSVIGIAAAQTLSYGSMNTKSMFDTVSTYMTNYRSTGLESARSLSFTEEDRNNVV